jgi:hypothetical protein
VHSKQTRRARSRRRAASGIVSGGMAQAGRWKRGRLACQDDAEGAAFRSPLSGVTGLAHLKAARRSKVHIEKKTNGCWFH